MRPLWVEYPTDEATFGIDNAFLVGSSLLVHPVVEPSATSASVYFPPGTWLDIHDYTRYVGPSTHNVDAPRNKASFF